MRRPQAAVTVTAPLAAPSGGSSSLLSRADYSEPAAAVSESEAAALLSPSAG